MDGQLRMAALGLARPRPRIAAQHRLLVDNVAAYAAHLVRPADAVPAYLQKQPPPRPERRVNLEDVDLRRGQRR